MRILVSNDDGIHARGIRVLAERLAQETENSIYVVAPDRERSATGHALTLHKPIRVQKVHPDGNVKGAWWTTGTPSDCVKFAIGALLEEPPDLIISGINAGANLGSDVLYSGTVSAALEGAMMNIPSLATSLCGKRKIHYEVAADFIAEMVKQLPAASIPGHTVLNVNVPDLPADEIKGVKTTEIIGVRAYNDYYDKRTDPRGGEYYWLSGEAVEGEDNEESDIWAVLNGFVSITPITFNLTDHSTLEQLNRWPALKTLTASSSQQSSVKEPVNSGRSQSNGSGKD